MATSLEGGLNIQPMSVTRSLHASVLAFVVEVVSKHGTVATDDEG
jgi:hypothetical protein